MMLAPIKHVLLTKNLWLALLLAVLHPQRASATINDSIVADILSLEEYFGQIVLHHPVIKQAKLWDGLAAQEMRMARGGFDPSLSGTYKAKQYDDKHYYGLMQGKLSVPLWIGEFESGYMDNSGKYLNPESTLPAGGLAYAGLSVPLAKGLLIDERRAALQQAKLFQQIAKAEQRKMINKLLWQAAKEYWDWYYTYHQYLMLNEGFKFFVDRFSAVKLKTEVGDLAPIDSVEAKINLENMEILLNQAFMETENARTVASNHLWGADGMPVEISTHTWPEEFDINEFKLESIENLLEAADSRRPELLKFEWKAKQLEVDKRLYTNKMLPKADLQYHLLNAGFVGGIAPKGPLFQNYALGVKFEIPVFLRQERAKLQQVKIKIEQNDLELQQNSREVANELRVIYNSITNVRKLIGLQENMVNNYTILRDGEKDMFESGESSVFLVNTRETKLVEAQIKLEKYKSEYGKLFAALYWATGSEDWGGMAGGKP